MPSQLEQDPQRIQVQTQQVNRGPMQNAGSMPQQTIQQAQIQDQPLSPAPSRASIPSPREVQTKPVNISMNSGIPSPLNPASGILRSQNPVLPNPNEPEVREKISLGFDVATAAVSTVVAPVTALKGAALGTGISEAMSLGFNHRLLTPSETGRAAMQSATFSVVSAGVVGQAAKVVPDMGDDFVRLATKFGPNRAVVQSVAARAAVNAGIGSGMGYLKSGGSPEAAKQGAMFGAAFSVAGDVIGTVAPIKIREAATRSVSRSYEQTLGTDQMWQPTTKQQILMKITGAQPNSPGTQAKASEVLSESYKQNYEQQGTLWKPNVKEQEMMTLTGAKPNVPSAGFSGFKGPQNTLPTMETKFGSEDAFDFAVTPKGSFQGINEGMAVKTPYKPTLYMGLSRGGFTTFAPANQQYAIENEYAPKQQKADPYGPVPEQLKSSIEKGGIGSKLSFERPKPLSMKNVDSWPTTQELTPKDFQVSGGSMKNIFKYEPPQEATSNQVHSQFQVTSTERISGVPNTQMARQSFQGEQYETEILTYPKNGLPSPPILGLNKITHSTTALNPLVTNPKFAVDSQPQQFTPQISIGSTRQRDRSTQDTIVKQGSFNLVAPQQNTRTVPFLGTTTTTRIPTPTKTTTTSIPPFIPQKNAFPLVPYSYPGVKAMEFGGNRFANENFIGELSIKRKYPIKTPEEFWG